MHPPHTSRALTAEEVGLVHITPMRARGNAISTERRGPGGEGNAEIYEVDRNHHFTGSIPAQEVSTFICKKIKMR
jgi:hypothetical protein